METKQDKHLDVLQTECERHIEEYPMLTAEEERILAQDGSETARERLVLSHQRLVHTIAANYSASGIAHEDLFQEGIVGLIKAVDAFIKAATLNTPPSNRLATFAWTFIRGAIIDYVHVNQKLVHLSDRQQRAVTQFRKAQYKIGYDATDKQIAAEMKQTINTVRTLRQALEYTIESLDAPIVDTDAELTLGDTLGGIDAGFMDVENKLFVEQLMTRLSSIEMKVIRLRYGFDGKPYTLRAVAKRLKKSHQWVSNTEATALKKMRALISEESIAHV